MSFAGKKIIWAVDITEDPEKSKPTLQEIRKWALHTHCQVLPVSIISRSVLTMPSEYLQSWQESLTRMALKMAQFAEKQDASLIILKADPRRIWNIFRLGGFAEVLMCVSRIPVLLLNSRSSGSQRVSSILFPTDFSKESKKALLRLKPWAKAFHAEILLLNQIERPTIFYSQFGEMNQPNRLHIEKTIQKIEKSRLKKASEWSRILKRDHIKCSTLVKREKNYLSKEIVEFSKKQKTNLIVMTNHSGPVAHFFLGNTVRDVFLHATCPVLIFYKPKTLRLR